MHQHCVSMCLLEDRGTHIIQPTALTNTAANSWITYMDYYSSASFFLSQRLSFNSSLQTFISTPHCHNHLNFKLLSLIPLLSHSFPSTHCLLFFALHHFIHRCINFYSIPCILCSLVYSIPPVPRYHCSIIINVFSSLFFVFGVSQAQRLI